MVATRTLAWVAGLLSVYVWRSGRVAKNSILTKHAFPEGYYARGDFHADCTTLKGGPDLKYCEDATFWDLLDAQGKFVDRGLLLSCDAGRKSWNTVMGPLRNPEPRGSLWLYQPEGKGNAGKGIANPSKLKRLELEGYPEGHDFHPLGVEIYPSYAGNASNLYVVNHARARTVIEQFTLSPFSPTVAKYVRTIVSPYLHSSNALALTSPDSFYVTNDHLLTRRIPYLGHILPILESVLALPLSFVSHVTLSPPSSGGPPIKTHQFSALFIPFPNGIALSPDGTQAALASTSLGKIILYSRNPTTNDLTPISDVPVPFVPDNIRYTHDGTALIVAGHPHFPTLTAVARNKTHAAPSWVVSIDMRGGTKQGAAQPKADFDRHAPVAAKGKVPPVAGSEVTTLFQSDGSGFSTSSTGLKDPVTGALYVTGLYAEEGFMVCQPSA
ncbi:putative serum paraoxonase arylesterase 2 [Lyophyllum shimeji]|uniref:Serum paraoxonase arylesterase 2 n=1 Tax=Lyophyllum shimeji TaxID=47721 RepID=A0A9P3UQI2_LYOSH|nr:putative serum paraoxonase arylesterase 2 [Lyophyllum shimeji]